MNSWSDIFTLFSSLSKSEKRHFKLLASLQEGEKKYLTLFDELEKLSPAPTDTVVWDENHEERLKNRLLRKGIGGQLQGLRSYLNALILKSLRMQEEGRTAGDEARARLREGVLLQRKGLFPLAIEKLEEALALAAQYELYEVSVEACTHLCYLKSQQNPKNYREEMALICEALETATGGSSSKTAIVPCISGCSCWAGCRPTRTTRNSARCCANMPPIHSWPRRRKVFRRKPTAFRYWPVSPTPGAIKP